MWVPWTGSLGTSDFHILSSLHKHCSPPPTLIILPNALSGCLFFSTVTKKKNKVSVTRPTMPENQDGDKNKMSLAKASAISWALESIPSSTGSERNDASEHKFVRPGLHQTGLAVRVGIIG